MSTLVDNRHQLPPHSNNSNNNITSPSQLSTSDFSPTYARSLGTSSQSQPQQSVANSNNGNHLSSLGLMRSLNNQQFTPSTSQPFGTPSFHSFALAASPLQIAVTEDALPNNSNKPSPLNANNITAAPSPLLAATHFGRAESMGLYPLSPAHAQHGSAVPRRSPRMNPNSFFASPMLSSTPYQRPDAFSAGTPNLSFALASPSIHPTNVQSYNNQSMRLSPRAISHTPSFSSRAISSNNLHAPTSNTDQFGFSLPPRRSPKLTGHNTNDKLFGLPSASPIFRSHGTPSFTGSSLRSPSIGPLPTINGSPAAVPTPMYNSIATPQFSSTVKQEQPHQPHNMYPTIYPANTKAEPNTHVASISQNDSQAQTSESDNSMSPTVLANMQQSHPQPYAHSASKPPASQGVKRKYNQQQKPQPTLTAYQPTSPESSSSSVGHSPLSNSAIAHAQLPHNGNGSGSSCHQCKSRRTLDKLVICKNLNATKPPKSAPKGTPHAKQCRKKFCHVCLQKFYNERVPPHPNNPKLSNWECPACRQLCCCAACRRAKAKADGVDFEDIPSAAATASIGMSLDSINPANLIAYGLTYFNEWFAPMMENDAKRRNIPTADEVSLKIRDSATDLSEVQLSGSPQHQQQKQQHVQPANPSNAPQLPQY